MATSKALSVFATYVMRLPPKPKCVIPEVLHDSPWVFDTTSCWSCKCQKKCRYDDDSPSDASYGVEEDVYERLEALGSDRIIINQKRAFVSS